DGGTASRITANPGSHAFPRLSPNGDRLAFVSRDEGRPEVHLMDAGGGPSRRLSHTGASTQVVGWKPDGSAVVASSDHAQAFAGWNHLWYVPVDGSQPQPLGVGPAFSVSFGPGGRMALGRNAFDPARWKRDRGGRSGNLWVDPDGRGHFRPLVSLPGNLASPMWIGRRIYFLSDHEGTGNLYSVTPAGRGLTRHTHHEDFYVRFPATDGVSVVYQNGADLWVFDPKSDESHRIEVSVGSARPQLNRRRVRIGRNLESIHLHPEGHSIALTGRGAAFVAPLWESAPLRVTTGSHHRRRLAAWLSDGERIVSVSDESGEERLVVDRVEPPFEEVVMDRDLGRIRTLDPSTAGAARVAVTNHRHELWIVDLGRRSARMIHRSPHTWIGGTAWSPDGRWLAFGAATSRTTMNIHLYDSKTRRSHVVGAPEFVDHSPSFDPDGRYLGFLSSRVYDPVADTVFHDYGFPRSTIPVVVTLRASEPSPFGVAVRPPRAPGANPNGDQPTQPVEVDIDLDSLSSRVRAIPIAPGRYRGLTLTRGKALFTAWPVEGARPVSFSDDETPRAVLQMWEFSSDKLETIAEGVTQFGVSGDAKVVAIRMNRRLRVVPMGWKDDKSGKDAPGRESGWIDLDRFTIDVEPVSEWRQMFSEAWRLQRDHFWTEDMSGVDWLAIHNRYAGLVERVASRSEFSDLMWEMQGELGTSHAYELGGDYRPEPAWSVGRLGADLQWSRGAWRITRIPDGDPWDPSARSPLSEPGLGISVGDRILAVDGVALSRTSSPDSRLVDKARRPVRLTVASGRRKPRTVIVTPLSGEFGLRYRDWVVSNRRAVAEMTDGRVGYIHIPDMQAPGFAEFHRSWRGEVDKAGLIVDVRFNRGGNVSQLLLEKLARRRLGYRVTRWREPYAFPTDAPTGAMVCLTNEMAGSDGDIFSHTFKLAGLGPLIGTRTWGGVVGIWPQHALVDGTITTQPEFGTWFTDVGFDVENYGTDPDIEVAIAPHEADSDPQLARAVSEILEIVERNPPGVPEFGEFPRTSPPRLP
ncbi:MAG: PDZ domain-containing protein, partial [Acidimicrobiia bacterium]|nr:PDZ domain-containing protein [Acidimicrobiia bacterium]